jgi:2-aminoadipate transaminase
MLPRAVTARVAYASGTGFYADGFGSRQLRLSYCYPSPERITEGVRRLAAVLDAELDVLRTFGSPARPAVGQGPQAPSPHTP